MSCSRRDFLKMGAGALAAGFLPLPALAANIKPKAHQRHLAFYNTHTGESLNICYFDQGDYCAKSLAKIHRILRDHRTNEVKPIDLRLIDTLYALKRKVGTSKPFHIISGYRSPATNAMLRKKSNGVARTSYHTRGKAVDIRIPGYSSRRLRDACLKLKSGGVGYYADSNFVHLDTGPKRNW